MARPPAVAISLPQPPTPPALINVSGTLNAGNSYQYSAPLGIAAAGGSQILCIIECLNFSMVNFLGIETQASTVGDPYAYSTTFYNDFSWGDGVATNQEEYHPLTLFQVGRMIAYDGVTDYAGTSGTLLRGSYAFDPAGGNSVIIAAADGPTALLDITAFMDHNTRAPATGTLLTTHYTEFAGTFQYYYI